MDKGRDLLQHSFLLQIYFHFYLKRILSLSELTYSVVGTRACTYFLFFWEDHLQLPPFFRSNRSEVFKKDYWIIVCNDHCFPTNVTLSMLYFICSSCFSLLISWFTTCKSTTYKSCFTFLAFIPGLLNCRCSKALLQSKYL